MLTKIAIMLTSVLKTLVKVSVLVSVAESGSGLAVLQVPQSALKLAKSLVVGAVKQLITLLKAGNVTNLLRDSGHLRILAGPLMTCSAKLANVAQKLGRISLKV